MVISHRADAIKHNQRKETIHFSCLQSNLAANDGLIPVALVTRRRQVHNENDDSNYLNRLVFNPS